jgi:hypothetical protein
MHLLESLIHENVAISGHSSDTCDRLLCAWHQPPDRAGHGITALAGARDNRRWGHPRR